MTNAQGHKKSILVTGSQGFIGSNLLNGLLPEYSIIGLNKVLDKKRKNYHPIKYDISKLSEKSNIGKFSSIIHFAAITDVKYCEKNPKKCFLTNVGGTLRMLEIARKKDCKFIYISTSHVYGNPTRLPIHEEDPKNPESIYAASKLAGEICCEGYAKSYGLDISILRLFSVYGPFSPPYLVTSRIISQLEKNSIKLGNLKPKRDFIFVDDAINAIKIVLEKSKGFQIYNIGTGKSYSILEICNLIKKISGKKNPVISNKLFLRKNDIKEIKAHTNKIKKLGWKPKTNIKRGLEYTINWHQQS